MVLLSSISGLTPAWLASAAAAAACVVALHLLARGRRRPVLYPPTALLMDTDRGGDTARRMKRLRDALVLVCRALAIALALLAFADPQWQGKGHASTDRSVVVLIDASASTTRLEPDGGQVFDRLRAAVDELIRALPPDTPARVVLAGRELRELLPEPTLNHEALRHALASAEPTLESGRLADAVAGVRQTPDATASFVIVVSDGQRSTMEGLDLEGAAPDRIIALPPRDRDNRAVVGITIDPARPRVGQPVSVGVEVRMWSDRPKASADVTLVANASERRISAPVVDGVGVATTTITPDRAGPLVLRAWLAGDAFAADDERSAVVSVRPRARVGLATSDPRGDLARVMRAAIAPSDASPYSIDVREIETVDSDWLATCDAVIVAGVDAALPAAMAEALVSGEAGVFAILRDAAEARRLAQLESRLPAALAEAQDLGPGEARWMLDDAEALGAKTRYRNAVGAVFSGFGEAPLVASSGRPLCVCTPTGGVLLVSPDPAFSRLAADPLFLPMLHDCLFMLIADESGDAPTFEPGEPIVLQRDTLPDSVAQEAASRLVDQRREPVRVRTLTAGTTALVLGAKDEPGVVAVGTANGEDDMTPVATVAVSPRESVAEYLKPQDVRATRRSPFAGGIIKAETPLRGTLLVIALALMIAESFLRRRSTRA